MNGYVGLANGPLDARFKRLSDRLGSLALASTTPVQWASGGPAVRIQFSNMGVEFDCELTEDDRLIARHVRVIDAARDVADAVGVMLRPVRVVFTEKGEPNAHADPGAAAIASVVRAAAAAWTDFVTPLRQLLAAAERDEKARAAALTVRYGEAASGPGASAITWRLLGIPERGLRGFDPGEWLSLQDAHQRSVRGRVIDVGRTSMAVEVPSGARPATSGWVRPEIRQRILDQKRALLDELNRPSGNLPHLVRLVAAPASLPDLTSVRPDRFVNPAVGRSAAQAHAVALALGLEDGQSMLVMGPPGTGKSTSAAEIDLQLILRDPGVRILVCSHSNHGADNMLLKVLPWLPDARQRVARVGFRDRVADDARPFYVSEPDEVADKNIVFTTIDALALRDAAGARLYDYVILDEANRAGVLDSLLALARGRRLILVGDAMQLAPVLSDSARRLRREDDGGVTESFFAWLQARGLPAGASVLLDEQNRMQPAIGELVSSVFYNGRVRTGPGAPHEAVTTPLIPHSVTWLDTRDLPASTEQRRLGQTSFTNAAEAHVVVAVVQHLRAHVRGDLSLGVITVYAEQRRLLRGLLADEQVDIDTVDAFEGREKDIVVLSLVRSNPNADVGFVREASRLNVALSRARRLLVIVGDTRTLSGGVFDRLLDEVRRVGGIVPVAAFAM